MRSKPLVFAAVVVLAIGLVAVYSETLTVKLIESLSSLNIYTYKPTYIMVMSL